MGLSLCSACVHYGMCLLAMSSDCTDKVKTQDPPPRPPPHTHHPHPSTPFSDNISHNGLKPVFHPPTRWSLTVFLLPLKQCVLWFIWTLIEDFHVQRANMCNLIGCTASVAMPTENYHRRHNYKVQNHIWNPINLSSSIQYVSFGFMQPPVS